MAARWTVDLLEHPSGSLIRRVDPENLHFLKQLGVAGPGEIDFELSLSAKDDAGRKIVTPDFIGPYRTDFRLRRFGILDPIMEGIVTSYGGTEAGEEHVKITGKDWLHYLEIRNWPYDADLSYVNYPDGFRFKVAAADVGQIVKDIAELVRDVSTNFPGAPSGFFTGASPSYSLAFTVNADVVGKNINFEITAFDSESIYSKIQTLAQADRGNGSFDFYMTHNKILRVVAPEIGDATKPALTLRVDPDTHFANMLSLGKTNTGPECTHVLGVGAGSSTRQGGVNKHFRHNSAIFRRIDTVADFGDVKNLDMLESLTSSKLSLGANPVHEVPVTVDPADFPGFWRNARVRPGVYLNVQYGNLLGYTPLHSVHRIISMDCNVDLEGNESVAFGLNQHYDVDSSTGLADW